MNENVKLTTVTYTTISKQTGEILHQATIKMPINKDNDEQWDDVRGWVTAQRKIASKELGVKL
jgi:hypothetical protein